MCVVTVECRSSFFSYMDIICFGSVFEKTILSILNYSKNSLSVSLKESDYGASRYGFLYLYPARVLLSFL